MPTSSYLDHPGPLAVAHRGGASDQPENSMAAFRAAVDLGFRYLETDVHVTRDGRLVAFHDASLDRVTDRTGRINDLVWEDVRQARIDGSAPIPLLEELLEEFPDARFNIDPKSDASVDPLIDTLRRSGAADRVCIGAFSDRRIERVLQALGPELCTGMGPKSLARLRAATFGVGKASIPGTCAQVPTSVKGVRLVTRRFVERVHALGKVVHVWTIDDPAEMHRLLDLGVDGIMTDRPAVLKAVYEERDVWV